MRCVVESSLRRLDMADEGVRPHICYPFQSLRNGRAHCGSKHVQSWIDTDVVRAGARKES
jgi:hypothetical protein